MTSRDLNKELSMTNQLWELHYQMWIVIGSIAERLFVRMK
jgi:hypothetical protein